MAGAGYAQYSAASLSREVDMLTFDDLQHPGPDACLTILKARLLDRMRAYKAATGDIC